MTDEQVKKILDKTFAEVNLLVQEVQKKKSCRHNFKGGGKKEKRKSFPGKESG